MANVCCHCFVSGRVQGVNYRQTTYGEAVRRGLTGWVKNLADGRVEVMLCGELDAVIAMRDWLWEGPKAAKVSAVATEEVAWQNFSQFEVRH